MASDRENQPSAPEALVVAAAVIEQDGCFLLTRRLAGTHLAGCWEFPGGKCEPGETHAAALARELHEELGVGVDVGPLVVSVAHTYPERRVELHFYRTRLLGDPRPQLGQEMRWVPRGELSSLDLPEADAALIDVLTDAC